MPELPEVETMVRGIRDAVVGRKVAALRACRCECRSIAIRPALPAIARRVRGTVVTGVRRLAKRVVIAFSSDDALVVEPRMTGLMLLADPPDEEHLRLRIDLAGDGPSLWFWDRRGLGTVALYSAEALATELGPHKFGPDALAMTPDQWWQRCRATKRSIKVAMLDQRFVAGIGNLYASEILHLAGVRPTRRASRLRRREVNRIVEAAEEVLHTAIRHEGSTLGDGTYRNALNQNGGFQNHHRVYARAGDRCPSCGEAEIQRLVQAQRSTFYCPACQR